MKTKRWRYRKVTPEMVKKIKKLRENEYTVADVAKMLGLSKTTVGYWLSDDYRKKASKRARKYKQKQRPKSEKRAYMQKYMIDRYRTDEEFRDRMRGYMLDYQKRMRKATKDLKKTYPEYANVIKTYFREQKTHDTRAAWRNFKRAVLRLRKEMGVYFPMKPA